ncbi:MAG: saccharopine dehydrogenase NADP-binding domain-containing protein [Candidatus Sabulitectum sp.]|nr:saccharopine dehydrogenase NADP-binding domain-containing protein [Candidatus Sabulitectum sp.]
MRIAVLGAGMVGSAIAVDLSKTFSVVAADIDRKALERLEETHGIDCVHSDLLDEQVVLDVIRDADMVVNAVPGFMGYKTLKTIIESGRNVVDIAFFPEDSAPLHRLAMDKGVIAVTDMGVAPGMCNVIFGYHYAKMKVNSYLCLVGGLPKKRTWPWEYKAPFSPCDVIEEYVRPARYRESGADVLRPALSDPELIEFDQCGTLEAWNSDGLRSLLRNMPDVPDMKEKTMRWPGHIEKARVLRESGFFSTEPVEVNGVMISPLQMTEKILFTGKNWKLGAEETEFTVMRVVVAGEENGRPVEFTWDLYDEYSTETKTSSMARTTGYACTAAVNAVLQGLYTEAGLSPAEYLGKDERCFDFMLNYLRERNVIYTKKKKSL